ncbi:hypothetical protein [Lactococcus protaetiae]|uniref:Uncharacterized protein n=1 Tax=Lactococcus protaetiae TaxID=2592653 RepID=A0A514Z7X8_9LACT|nr:hypothetical protein [Lactococcus protaetiae]QDK70696.1 hypothetical protein FLP15_05445 [Lactococcus protaetiae]
MWARNCKNCGASSFNHEKGKMICTYCGTEYKEDVKPRSRKNIWLSILALTFVAILILSYLIARPNFAKVTKQTISSSMRTKINYGVVNGSVNSPQFAHEHINSLKGWTLVKYQNIHLAEQHINQASAYPTYTNGDLYTNVEKIIGSKPTKLEESRTQGTDIQVTATWDSGATLKDGTVSIMLIYDKATGQITTKILTGQVYGN